MKKKLDFRRMAAFVLCLLLCGAWAPVKASAADLEANCTLDLYFIVGDEDHPMDGVTFRFYRVQSVAADGTLTGYTEKFQVAATVLTGKVGNDEDMRKNAQSLLSFVAGHSVEPDRTAATDGEGGIHLTGLEPGCYLIQGSSKTYNGWIYTPTTVLITLSAAQPNVATHVKYGAEAISYPDPTVQRHVLKVWEDEGSEDKRPESVTVDLFRDGELYASEVLSAENSWRHDWTNLNAGHDWQVAEREVEGYTVSVSQTGTTFASTFVITNTIDEDLEDPDTPKGNKDPEETKSPEETKDPEASKSPDEDGDEDGEDIPDNDTPLTNLPQTGQLWWPVPLMAMGGMVLTFLGVMRRRRWSVEDEE